MELKEKIIKHFEGKVVRKDLTALVKGNNPVPVYVLEYLLGQYCAIDDEEIIQSGIETVRNVIRDNYVHRSDSEIAFPKSLPCLLIPYFLLNASFRKILLSWFSKNKLISFLS